MHVILRFNVSPEGPGVPQAVRRDIGVACLDYVMPVRKTIQLLTNYLLSSRSLVRIQQGAFVIPTVLSTNESRS